MKLIGVAYLFILAMVSTWANDPLQRVEVEGSNQVSPSAPTVIQIKLPEGVLPSATLVANDVLQVQGTDDFSDGFLNVVVDLSKLKEQQKNALENHECVKLLFQIAGLPNTLDFFGELVIKREQGSSFSFRDGEAVDHAGDTANAPHANAENGGMASRTSGDTKDPVSTATREYFYYERLMDLNSPILPLTFELYHGSRLKQLAVYDSLPDDFSSNHHLFARKTDFFSGGFFQLQFGIGLGQFVSFTKQNINDDWELSPGERWKFDVVETSDYYYLKDPGRQRVWIYKKFPVGTTIEPAYCLQILDRHGNSLTYALPADPTRVGPLSVTDGLGRTLHFEYAPADQPVLDPRLYLTEVRDHTGRAFEFKNVEIDGRVRMTRKTDPLLGEYQCAYDANGFMISKSLPEGNTPYTQTFEAIPDFFLFNESQLGAVTSQTNAFGQMVTFAQGEGFAGLGATLVTTTNPDGSEQRHFHNEANLLTAIIDETGAVMAFTPDDANDVFLGFTDRDGDKGSFTYRPDSGHLASMTDAKGSTTTYAYTESAPQNFQNPEVAESVAFTFLDLTRIDYADGTFHSFTYDAAGNPLTATDRAGDTITLTYNARGQLLTSTNEEGGVTTFTYDPTTGLLDTATDTDTGVTDFDYDPLSRLTTVTRPDANTVDYTYDALDRVVTATDEENVVTRFAYDANSNVTGLTRAEGTPEEQVFAFDYDLLDRLVKVTDPINSETDFEYDYHDKPTRVVFPDTSDVAFGYDERRELVSVLDEAGKILEIARTPSALVESVTSPENRTSSLVRDPLGQVVEAVDASGDRTSVERDVFSRATLASDGLQRISTVIRDGEGRVTSRTEPTVGTTAYTYDGNGRLTQLSDARGNDWDFSFTPMGRRQGIEDPQNHSETRTYDSRGRLQTITHPGGVVETRTYHPDSRLATRTFSDGLAHSFTYDPLNRLSQTTRELNAVTETCSYTYDSRSNRTGTTVNGNSSTATFDLRNRLKTVVYPGGVTVTYTYDARGLVTQVTDSLSGAAIDFEYNADRQLVKSTRSNGRVTDLGYDAEGLLQQVMHDNGASIDVTFNAADELTSLVRVGFPADGSGGITAGTETFTFNANSEITNGGFSYDDRGRPDNVTWDSDNRLVAVNNGSPISYRYDALGQITARTEGETTTEYLYNAAIRSNPILGEKEGANFTRFYVALPDGQVVYHIDDPAGSPTVRFHHHGQTGNVRFLTDAAGTVTDSYAYDAYGRLLEKNGSSTQFYQYVGRRGVRTDEAAGLIQMRQRYYDPNAGRFLSRDPIFLSLMARAGLEANPYHYTAGAPSYRSDPSGLDSGPKVIKIVRPGYSEWEEDDEDDYWDDDEDDWGPTRITVTKASELPPQDQDIAELIPRQKGADCSASKRASRFAIGLDGRLVRVGNAANQVAQPGPGAVALTPENSQGLWVPIYGPVTGEVMDEVFNPFTQEAHDHWVENIAEREGDDIAALFDQLLPSREYSHDVTIGFAESILYSWMLNAIASQWND